MPCLPFKYNTCCSYTVTIVVFENLKVVTHTRDCHLVDLVGGSFLSSTFLLLVCYLCLSVLLCYSLYFCNTANASTVGLQILSYQRNSTEVSSSQQPRIPPSTTTTCSMPPSKYVCKIRWFENFIFSLWNYYISILFSECDTRSNRAMESQRVNKRRQTSRLTRSPETDGRVKLSLAPPVIFQGGGLVLETAPSNKRDYDVVLSIRGVHIINRHAWQIR